MKKILLLFLVILFCRANTSGQSYIGNSIDNYSGIHGVLNNPASIHGSGLKLDINLISTSAFAGSDYISLDKKILLEINGEFFINDSIEKFSRSDNNIYGNLEVLGPSAMYQLSPKHSIGITTRLRSFLNLNGISGQLIEDFIEDFDSKENYDFNMNKFNGTAHIWGEIGLTYGRSLLEFEGHRITGGISLKYLLGGGALYSNTTDFQGRYNMFNEILTTTGSLRYGSTPGIDSDYINVKRSSSGVAGDAGIVYRLLKNEDFNGISLSQNTYKLKVGISVTDIGTIHYNNSEEIEYNMINELNTNNLTGTSIEEILEENYREKERKTFTSEINLPTAIHGFIDYYIQEKLFVSINGSFSLLSDSKKYANRIINTVTATPRFESKLFSFYLPLSVRQYEVLSAGAGFRFGPLTLGSGSVLTNLFSDRARSTDIYLALKIPFYR
ncbi:DUF5723 family protein [Christiangramia sabulilitoris]|uniref:DUF5723 domain-containing protein n=1 Tax=Christiangramia sabulilitoris TaxID=2583991 RepID=A0A550HX68_9FLAO|nr:DUF5723 family protein [Christiangramia sabulilitoris]TRO63323.1 hypothetical protein FGM01_13735 [Christiangramia sabulilitoris]